MLDQIARFTLPAAYSLLPPHLESPEATAMLLAIALQESGAHYRQQVNGPARGFWQFEQGGVRAVLGHGSTGPMARASLAKLCYSSSSTVPAVHAALEHNDVLAALMARLLLWPVRADLPGRGMNEEGWQQYLAAWRPGKPRRVTWDADFDYAWQALDTMKELARERP